MNHKNGKRNGDKPPSTTRGENRGGEPKEKCRGEVGERWLVLRQSFTVVSEGPLGRKGKRRAVGVLRQKAAQSLSDLKNSEPQLHSLYTKELETTSTTKRTPSHRCFAELTFIHATLSGFGGLISKRTEGTSKKKEK